MKKLFFILIGVLVALLAIVVDAFAVDLTSPETAQAIDTGLTFLETLLICLGVSGGSLAVILVKAARGTVKTLLKSLDSNPYVKNKDLLLHATREGDQKATKEFKKIN